MSKQAFEKELSAALHSEPPASTGQRETAALARAMVTQRGAVVRIGFAEFLGEQVRFIGWKIWLLQALCLLALSSTMDGLLGGLYFLNGYIAMQCLSCLSVLVLLTALPFLASATRYQMHEVEAATHFSSLWLLAAKLLLVGAGDLVMLVSLWIYALLRTPLSADALPFCLLLPFLAAAAGLVTLLRHASPRGFSLGCVLWCAVLCSAGCLSSRWLWQFAESTLLALALCAALLGYCALMLHKLWRENAFTELQLS